MMMLSARPLRPGFFCARAPRESSCTALAGYGCAAELPPPRKVLAQSVLRSPRLPIVSTLGMAVQRRGGEKRSAKRASPCSGSGAAQGFDRSRLCTDR